MKLSAPIRLTVTLCNSMVKRREALVVCSVQGALVLQQERNHGCGTNGCGAMDGVLAAAVADAG
jgi:hypothetical protein